MFIKAHKKSGGNFGPRDHQLICIPHKVIICNFWHGCSESNCRNEFYQVLCEGKMKMLVVADQMNVRFQWF